MLTFDNFLKYYNSQGFVKGMRNYFNVEDKDGYSVILHMDQHFRTHADKPHLKTEQDGDEKSIYFATIFFFMAMCNHTIYQLLGMDSLQNFLRATQWPMISCGLAGICPPQQTLQEADLVYEKNSENCQKAYALFCEVVPFMKEELNNFFSGNDENLNQAAYDAFCKAIAGKVDEFWQIADPLIEEFTFYRQ